MCTVRFVTFQIRYNTILKISLSSYLLFFVTIFIPTCILTILISGEITKMDIRNMLYLITFDYVIYLHRDL